MAKKNIHLIVAARPNFMKIAPLYDALKYEDWANPIIVHTGQHYNINMSDDFFRDLNLPSPHIHLGLGSGTHAEQTGLVMMSYEKILMEEKPDMVVVVGDVNSTLAATLVAVKLNIKVAHLEAGLRSFDRTMPEEINRVATDALVDLLWTPSSDGDENLILEGVAKEKIVRVGNIMIDSLEMMRDKIEREDKFRELGLDVGKYGLVTLHRPSNVDAIETLKPLCESFVDISKKIPLVFPIHPRTQKNIEDFGILPILEQAKQIYLLDPQSYILFMNLLFNCALAITDSGGMQEETTYLGIPCLTLRANTERPITISQGTNQLSNVKEIKTHVDTILSGGGISKEIPELWDGLTAKRVVKSIRTFLG